VRHDQEDVVDVVMTTAGARARGCCAAAPPAGRRPRSRAAASGSLAAAAAAAAAAQRPGDMGAAVAPRSAACEGAWAVHDALTANSATGSPTAAMVSGMQVGGPQGRVASCWLFPSLFPSQVLATCVLALVGCGELTQRTTY
jgi:hypothetical protein